MKVFSVKKIAQVKKISIDIVFGKIMQILDSMSQFFSSFKQSDTNSFEAVSESSTKIQFKDYLHDAMDEAGSKTTISFKKEIETNSENKINSDIAFNPTLEAPFESFQIPFQNETNFLLSKAEHHAESEVDLKEEVLKSSDVPTQAKPENLEIIEEEIQENKVSDEDSRHSIEVEIDPDKATIVIPKLEQANESSKLESELKENNQIFPMIEQSSENKIESPIGKNFLSGIEIDSRQEKSEISTISLNEKAQTIETPEIKKEIPKQTQPKQNSESLLKELVLSPNNTKPELKSERTLELKEVISEKQELKTQNFDIVKKEKKENSKTNLGSAHSDSKDVKQSDLIHPSKEKNNSKDSADELISLDKTKWTISRKEGSTFDSRKENNSNPSSNQLASQKLESDKMKIELPLSKFETEFKSLEKPKDMKPEKEIFQKSLNELVQKARMNIVEGGKNSAQISLQPGDLGKMTLNIEVVKDRVEGKIFVDSESIKTVLLNDLLSLKEDFKTSGLSLDSLSVEVKSENHTAKQYSDFDENRKFAESQRNIFGNNKESILKVEEFSSPAQKLLDVRV